MGLYIKNMEMPKGNDELRLIIRSNGQVIISHETYYEETEAVPVPPHGRLIDGDKLAEEQKENVGAYHANLITLNDLAEFLLMQSISEDYAPTIIPASEEGE